MGLWVTTIFLPDKLVKEPITARPVTKSIEQIYPSLGISQTEMKVEPGYMMLNFRQYKTTYYKVSGIVENQKMKNFRPKCLFFFTMQTPKLLELAQPVSLI